MNTYGGVDAWSHVFLTSAPDGDKWLASRSFTPWYTSERKLGGPRFGLRRNEKNLVPARNRTRAIQPVGRHCTELNSSIMIATAIAILTVVAVAVTISSNSSCNFIVREATMHIAGLCLLFRSLFPSEDGRNTFLRSLGQLLPNYTGKSPNLKSAQEHMCSIDMSIYVVRRQ
jgi:hypothetical protein